MASLIHFKWTKYFCHDFKGCLGGHAVFQFYFIIILRDMKIEKLSPMGREVVLKPEGAHSNPAEANEFFFGGSSVRMKTNWFFISLRMILT